MAIVLNPNQPRPVVLSSNQCPPPVWPLAVANWVVLPVVPEGFPMGPFPPQPLGPISDGTRPVFLGCAGVDMVSLMAPISAPLSGQQSSGVLPPPSWGQQPMQTAQRQQAPPAE